MFSLNLTPARRSILFFLALAILFLVFALGQSAQAAVTVSTFSATWQAPTILVKWKTVSEVNNVGFSVKRSDTLNGTYSEIHFEASQNPGGLGGANYSFTDEGNLVQGKTYFYQLWSIDASQFGEMSKQTCAQGDTPCTSSPPPSPTRTATKTKAPPTATRTTVPPTATRTPVAPTASATAASPTRTRTLTATVPAGTATRRSATAVPTVVARADTTDPGSNNQQVYGISPEDTPISNVSPDDVRSARATLQALQDALKPPRSRTPRPVSLNTVPTPVPDLAPEIAVAASDEYNPAPALLMIFVGGLDMAAFFGLALLAFLYIRRFD
ncbi:MAG: hypothetical protein ACM3JD_01610 [Rudaea sp.]